MAIELGVACAMILKQRKGNDLEGVFVFYRSIQKSRTDRVTRMSCEVGKLLASVDIDDPERLTGSFNPEALMEKMRWVKEYDRGPQLFWELLEAKRLMLVSRFRASICFDLSVELIGSILRMRNT